MPREVFLKYRNENMKNNYLEEIAKVDANAAAMLQNATFQQIQQFVKQYNDSISGVNPGNPTAPPAMGSQTNQPVY